MLRDRGIGRHPALALATCAALSLAVLGCGGAATSVEPRTASKADDGPPIARPAASSAATVVRRRSVVLVDRSRTVHHPNGLVRARRLVTVVRYPETQPASPPRARPLIVFAHGFDLLPGAYRRLLTTWARAGYVVAAPRFPGEAADAPGGPDRSDLLQEPADLRLVIGRLARASGRRGSFWHGRIDARRIAVAGHSDGGDAALAVAYDSRFRVARIDAALILAGADLPGLPAFRFPSDGPPLLAVQGSADRLNPPADTNKFFSRARAPKVLMRLPSAGHYRPYMARGRTFAVVARATTAFLRKTLTDSELPWRRVLSAARRPGVSTVRSRIG